MERLQQQLSRSNRDREASNSKVLGLESEILILKKELRKSNDALSASNIRLRTSQIMQNSHNPKIRNPASRTSYGGSATVRFSESNPEDLVAIRNKILTILTKYDAKKVDQLDSLMEKYEGRENILLKKLVNRYEEDDQSILSEYATETKQGLTRSELAMQRHKERMQSIRRKSALR